MTSQGPFESMLGLLDAKAETATPFWMTYRL